MANTVLKPLKEEAPIDALRRAASWLDHTDEDFLQVLPSVEACLDFFNLIANKYDVSTFDEVLEEIAEGASVRPLTGFIRRWRLQNKWPFTFSNEDDAVCIRIRASLNRGEA